MIATLMFGAAALAQNVVAPIEVVWEQSFDSEVLARQNGWRHLSTSAVGFLSEPAVGMDWSAGEGMNPVRSVATRGCIYLLDYGGTTVKQIPLDWREDSPENRRGKAPLQSGDVSPDGKHYVVYDREWRYEDMPYLKTRVVRRDSTLVLELSGQDASEVAFFPAGQAMMGLHYNYQSYLSAMVFYDSLFSVVRRVDVPENRSFHNPRFAVDGECAIVSDRHSIFMFDASGNETTLRDGAESSADRARSLGGDHAVRFAYRDQLRRTLPGLEGTRLSLPDDKFRAEKQRIRNSGSTAEIAVVSLESRIRAQQGIVLSPSGDRGVFNTGSRLVLFKRVSQ